MELVKRYSFVLFLIFPLTINLSIGQQVPLVPVSYRIFSPFIFNPAIAGSKDFSSIDFISSFQGKSYSQIISVNSRLTKKGPSYFMTSSNRQYSHFGIGGYLFNEKMSPSRNMGLSAVGSYQIPLDQKSVSFLSFGVAIKGVYNIMDSIYSSDTLLSFPGKKIFYPNIDIGIYYYGPKLFAGISATNLLGNPEDPDSSGVYRLPVARHYFLMAGYKIILSKSLDIVLEPSLILDLNGYTNQKARDFLEPMLKLYVQSFCLGTYFNNYDNISFFFQFKYPKFYVGTFFEIPRNTAYYKKNINVEITFGMNFSVIKSRDIKYYHW
jgi:type IX secretion system PorP/SprF family membrane protein